VVGIKRPRILIVDDEQHIVTLLSMTLRRRGYEVLTADNGPRALELAEAFELSLLIVDQSMPGMTGVDLAKKLSRSMPVLMVTAKPVIESSWREHIAAVIQKPFSPNDLVSRVEALVGPGKPSKEQSA